MSAKRKPHVVQGLDAVHAVKVRRRRRHAARRSSSLVTLAPNVQGAIVRLADGPPLLVSAAKALVFAAKMLRRTQDLIRRVEAAGCKNAALALQRHAATVRSGVHLAADRARRRWHTAQQVHHAQVMEAAELRSVAHCREWASW